MSIHKCILYFDMCAILYMLMAIPQTKSDPSYKALHSLQLQFLAHSPTLYREQRLVKFQVQYFPFLPLSQVYMDKSFLHCTVLCAE